MGSNSFSILYFRKKEQKRFKGLGYEPHLVETLEKDLLINNPDVKWNHIAGSKNIITVLIAVNINAKPVQ
jgi:hypothetical protein